MPCDLSDSRDEQEKFCAVLIRDEPVHSLCGASASLLKRIEFRWSIETPLSLLFRLRPLPAGKERAAVVIARMS